MKASVGKNGKNNREDVRLVQKRLNLFVSKIGVPRLVEDGIIGPKTIGAIILFQRKIAGHSFPDGLIEPNKSTWKLLFQEVKFIQLPKYGSGYYLYTSSNKTFGTKSTIASIKSLALKVKENLKLEIAIGDISLMDGSLMPPHKSHRKGVDVDLRPMRKDGKRLPVNYKHAEYSHSNTKKLVELIRKDPNVDLILFNDPEISGVRSATGHDNHLHVRYRR